MARQKNRVTFFWRDIDMTNDSRMRKTLRRHGGLAVAVYEEVLAMVYETGSYFLPWLDDYALDIADRLYEPDQEKIRQIIGMLVEVGLFSKEIFDEFGILTSRGIQERFTDRGEQSHRRREIHDYALIDGENARNRADLRDNARNCAEMRDSARFCAKPGPKDKAKDKAKEKDCTRALSLSVNTQERVRARGDESDFLSLTLQTAEPQEEEALQPEKPGLSPPAPPLRAGGTPSHESDQKRTDGDSRGDCGNSERNAESLSVPGVISEWNKRFKGTRSEYRYFYATGFLDENIRHRLKLDPDIETFRKVFDYARLEFDGRGIDGKRFIWSLPGLFNKEESFDLLLSKAAVGNISPARGAPVLTAQDYDRDPW